MKICIAIVVLVSCVLAEAWTPKSVEQRVDIDKACKEKYNITPDQFKKMDNNELPEEESVRKYVLCLADGLELLTSEQGIDVERTVKHFGESVDPVEFKKSAEDCIAKHPKGSKATDVHIFEVYGCLFS